MFNSRNKNKVSQYKAYKLMNSDLECSELKIYKNKKKIRNWDTLVKKIEEQKLTYMFSCASDLLDYLNEYDMIYMKLNIDPWNRLEKRNPPDWYKKLFVASLIEVYDNWYNLMSELKLEHYLKVWIYGPNFYKSQVVLAINDRISRYERLYCDFLDIEDGFTLPFFPTENTSLKSFTWEKHYEEIPCYPEDHDQRYLDKMEQMGKLHYVVQDDVRLAIFREGIAYLGCRGSNL